MNIVLPNLPDAARQRLCITWHWSVNRYEDVNGVLKHYHFIAGHDGIIHPGVPIEYNIPPLTRGRYAEHVKAANSYNIGISACAMRGAEEARAMKGQYGEYPVTKAQFEAMVELTAILCQHYGIPVTPQRVLGHKEWHTVLGKPQDRWDFNCIPHLDIRPESVKQAMENGGRFRAMELVRDLVRKRIEGTVRLPPATDAQLTAADKLLLKPAFSLLYRHFASLSTDGQRCLNELRQEFREMGLG